MHLLSVDGVGGAAHSFWLLSCEGKSCKSFSLLTPMLNRRSIRHEGKENEMMSLKKGQQFRVDFSWSEHLTSNVVLEHGTWSDSLSGISSSGLLADGGSRVYFSRRNQNPWFWCQKTTQVFMFFGDANQCFSWYLVC